MRLDLLSVDLLSGDYCRRFGCKVDTHKCEDISVSFYSRCLWKLGLLYSCSFLYTATNIYMPIEIPDRQSTAFSPKWHVCGVRFAEGRGKASSYWFVPSTVLFMNMTSLGGGGLMPIFAGKTFLFNFFLFK